MGGRGGPLWQRVTYHMGSNTSAAVPAAGRTAARHGVIRTENSAGIQHEEAVPSFFCWLKQQLAQLDCSQQSSAAAALPFDFWGGFVGYLGYELKEECGFLNSHSAATPDAAMFLADRRVIEVVRFQFVDGSCVLGSTLHGCFVQGRCCRPPHRRCVPAGDACTQQCCQHSNCACVAGQHITDNICCSSPAAFSPASSSQWLFTQRAQPYGSQCQPDNQ